MESITRQESSTGAKMKALDKYLKLQKEIFDYFGYVEDWAVIPIDDRREMYWSLEQDEHGRGHVTFFDQPLTPAVIKSERYYQDEIYTQRFLPKWVYRGEKYTMVCVDTRTDGNKFLAIYDNTKEQDIKVESFVEAMAQMAKEQGWYPDDQTGL